MKLTQERLDRILEQSVGTELAYGVAALAAEIYRLREQEENSVGLFVSMRNQLDAAFEDARQLRHQLTLHPPEAFAAMGREEERLRDENSRLRDEIDRLRAEAAKLREDLADLTARHDWLLNVHKVVVAERAAGRRVLTALAREFGPGRNYTEMYPEWADAYDLLARCKEAG